MTLPYTFGLLAVKLFDVHGIELDWAELMYI